MGGLERAPDPAVYPPSAGPSDSRQGSPGVGKRLPITGSVAGPLGSVAPSGLLVTPPCSYEITRAPRDSSTGDCAVRRWAAVSLESGSPSFAHRVGWLETVGRCS